MAVRRKKRGGRSGHSTPSLPVGGHRESPEAARAARLRQQRSRRLTSRVLFGTAVVVAVQHFAYHLTGADWGVNATLVDVLVGYPTAGALAVSGGIALGP